MQVTPLSSVRKVLGWLPFVISAAVASLALHASIQHPWLGAVLLGVAALLLIPNWLMRRRLGRLFLSADVPAVLGVLESLLRYSKAAETLLPLAKATALAAYGRLDDADHMLRFVPRGSAWDAAGEQRLVFELLRDSFEGKRARALDKAQDLSHLPLPLSPWARHHTRILRGGMQAFARAFARVPQKGDIKRLRSLASDEPLLAWPMRYAEAIIEVDRGNLPRSRQILAAAPAWPQGSVFADFQAEFHGVAPSP